MENKADVLSERFLDFGAMIIKLCADLRRTVMEREIALQLFRSATSIGANYEEARGAQSNADFVHKLRIAFKETKESIYWLKLIHRSDLISGDPIAAALKEAEIISRILAKSLLTASSNKSHSKHPKPPSTPS